MTGFSVELSTDILVKNIYMQAAAEAVFSDNFIDLLPGQPITIHIETAAKDWESLQLSVTSLVETLPTP